MHLDDEGRSLLMRKPMRLKNIEGRPEVYDTLHCKGREVSHVRGIEMGMGWVWEWGVLAIISHCTWPREATGPCTSECAIKGQ